MTVATTEPAETTPAAAVDEPCVVDIDHVSIDYRVGRAHVPAVRDAAMRVNRGEVVAIVGESGSGKSTLVTAVIQMLPATARLSGVIRVDGIDVTTLKERQLRALRGVKIGFVPQDPMTSLTPTHRIGKQVAETMLIHRTHTKEQARGRTIELLREAGLPDPERVVDLYPHELSGGMRQRVLIAMAFAGDPDVIIADEPTSALDVTVARAVMDRLSLLVTQHRKALMIITHDLAMAMHRADYLIVMKRGEIVETGTPEQIESGAKDVYTRELLSYSPRLDMEADDAVVSRVPIEQFRPGAGSLLEVEGLRKVFRKGHGRTASEFVAVEDVSFAIPQGATFGIVGESGSGKSTTARMILRLEEPTAGAVRFDGRDITRLAGEDMRLVRRDLQVVYQSPFDSMNPRMRVGEIIDEPMRSFGVGTRAERRRRVEEMLSAVQLPRDYAGRYPSELSGGQRQRVAIARALAVSPRLVVLDEPISALDVMIQAQILDLLRELQKEFEVSYLFISHDLATVQHFADYVAVMRHGAVIETGQPRDVFRAPQHDYTRDLLDSARSL